MAHPLLNAKLDRQEAQKLIGLTLPEQEYVKRNADYIRGDHWRGGLGYTGPMPQQRGEAAAELMGRIRRLFASKNVPLEVVTRQVNSGLGKHPDVALDVRRFRKKVPSKEFPPAPTVNPPGPPGPPNPNTPPAAPPPVPPPVPPTDPPLVQEPLTPAEEQLIEEGMNAVQVWLRDRNALKLVRAAFARRLWAGRSYLRLFAVTRPGQKPPTTLEEAIDRIWIDEPDIESAIVDTDQLTREQISITRFQRDRERPDVFAYEVCFTDDKGLTFIGVIDDPQNELRALPPPMPGGAGAPVVTDQLPQFPVGNLSSGFDLRGHLPVYQWRGDLFITEQVIQNTQSINLSLTMANHVLVETGFSELALTNVELEKEEVADGRAQGGKRQVAKAIRRGAGIINNFVGVEDTDAAGNVRVATPGVHWKEPSPLDSHAAGKLLAYQTILEEVHQLHALIAGDSTSTGEARIQALVDHIGAALDYKDEIDALGRWLVECALYMAAAMINRSEEFLELKAVFDSKVYVGPLSSDQQTALMQQVEKKLRSRKNARALLDIADSDAMEEEIRREATLSVIPGVTPLPAPPQPPNSPAPGAAGPNTGNAS